MDEITRLSNLSTDGIRSIEQPAAGGPRENYPADPMTPGGYLARSLAVIVGCNLFILACKVVTSFFLALDNLTRFLLAFIGIAGVVCAALLYHNPRLIQDLWKDLLGALRDLWDQISPRPEILIELDPSYDGDPPVALRHIPQAMRRMKRSEVTRWMNALDECQDKSVSTETAGREVKKSIR